MIKMTKKLKMISFTKFSQICPSHVQDGETKRCFCNEVESERIMLCNLANCPIFAEANQNI